MTDLSMTEAGLFITFEGPDGSGKTTQMRILVDRLRAEGYAVTENQEPGATAIGSQIRRILLNPANAEMAPLTELLLMFASRTQAAAEIVIPALQRGEIVVSDRWTDSTLAYQGQARGLGFDTVLKTHQLALGTLQPHLTVCVTIDIETGLARAHHRNQQSERDHSEARLDRQSLDFHRRVIEGYSKVASLEPDRFRLIDGRGDSATVAIRIWDQVNPLLQKAVLSRTVPQLQR